MFMEILTFAAVSLRQYKDSFAETGHCPLAVRMTSAYIGSETPIHKTAGGHPRFINLITKNYEKNRNFGVSHNDANGLLSG